MRMDGSKLPAGQTPQWADMRARLRSISRIDDGRAPTRLRQLINNSPHREREVVERHYFDNMPMRRVAGRLRVWLSMAYRLRGLAIEQLRQLRGAGSAAVG
jgi:DNA-directed RNA polymerase specialized sigma24 family protein